jgi:hypothetical protein
MTSRIARNTSSAASQHGQAMMIAMVIVILGVSGVIYTTATSGIMALANRQADDTTRAMAQVKEALIGWSASRTPVAGSLNRRPGELPCPDNDNTGTDSGSCVAGAIGRVPWKSLGIPEPKDANGETLWYAIAGPFRNFNMSSGPITSDTVGDLTVYLDSSTATITSQAVAVIFAPGAALGTQDRSTTVAACATTGTNIARNLCAANYLESTGGGNNAQTGGPFIQAQKSSTFNDRALAITNADLMPLVEQRVAREIIGYLNAYRAATATSTLAALLPGVFGGVYPWGDLGDGNSNAALLPLPSNYYNKNRFPCGTALPVNWAVTPTGAATATPTLPNWLTNGCGTATGWAGLIYYTVAKGRLETSGLLCTTCTAAASLTVANASGLSGTVCSTASPPVCTTQVITAGNADLVLITPGGESTSRTIGAAITDSWQTNTWNAISTLYFADAANRDQADDSYTVPASTSHNRNRIYIVR